MDGRKVKMKPGNDGRFSYTFKKLQVSTDLSFEAAGFYSDDYQLEVVSRPNLKSFNVYLDYPDYIHIPDEVLNNVGNLQVAEGTRIKWQISTLEADSMTFKFENDDVSLNAELVDNQVFEFEKRLLE